MKSNELTIPIPHQQVGPEFYVRWWAALYFLALATPCYNYFLANPPSHNWAAWISWGGSLFVAIIIYRIPGPPDPKRSDKPKHRVSYIIASILPPVLVVIHSAGYYYLSQEFNLHRASMQTDFFCINHIQEFSQNQGTIRAFSNSKYDPALSDTAARADKGLRCVYAQLPSAATKGFWEWSFLVGDYYGAVGAATIAMNDNAIEAKAAWIPIYSTWYKHGDTHWSIIEARALGRVSCNYSEFSKTLNAALNVDPSTETPDDYFIAIAKLNGTSRGERVQAKGTAQIFVDKYKLKSIKPKSPWLDLEVSKQATSQNNKLFAYEYLCRQRPRQETTTS